MTVDPPPLFTGLRALDPRRLSFFNPSDDVEADAYIELDSIQAKLDSKNRREEHLRDLKKAITKVMSLFEVSIIMNCFLVLVNIYPPSLAFWYYLEDSSGQNSIISDKTTNVYTFSHFSTALIFCTLGTLVSSYLSHVWESCQSMTKFVWLFVIVNIISFGDLVFQSWHLVWIFSLTVSLFLRCFVFVFNLLTAYMGYKVVQLYKLSYDKGSYPNIFELQEIETRFESPAAEQQVAQV